MNRSYCLITPCRDEAAHARTTLESVTSQTAPPALWVIVDDGSTDGTAEILREYAERFPYIRIVQRQNRGFRKLGGGVIDAFYEGYLTIRPGDFGYICKLDLDLDLPRTYFAKLMDRMEANPRLGTCSGKPYFRNQHGKLISEACGDENSVGMAKFYRRECFQEIGGFVRYLMWDGIDGHRCRMRGWVAESIDDPEFRFVHLRPMGTSHKNWWTGRMRHGIGQYYMGTGFIYMSASALYRMTRPPRVIGGIAMMAGYLKHSLRRAERYEDPEFRKFLRAYQWRCLLTGKHRATEWINKRQQTQWKRSATATGLHVDGDHELVPSG